MSNKTCKKCLAEKPISEFNRHPPAKDGLTYNCKNCSFERHKERRQKAKQKPEPWFIFDN